MPPPRRRGFGFLDAPVSGGQAGAQNGVLTVMVGGDKDVYEQAEPVMAAYARMVKLIGPSGSGQLTKMVNQICIAGLVQGLSEGLHFAQKAGLDIPAVVETISKGAAQSWQMDNRWKAMMEGKFDFGFAVDWMRKDLSIGIDEARRNGAHLPVAALIDQFYSEVQRLGRRPLGHLQPDRAPQQSEAASRAEPKTGDSSRTPLSLTSRAFRPSVRARTTAAVPSST